VDCKDTAVGVNREGALIDLDSLHAWLGKLSDRRHARGVRYRLVVVLVLIVLAKLAGEDRVSGIAEWVHHRARLLAELWPGFGGKAPHRTTLSRILAWAVDVCEFEKTVQQFFASVPGAGRSVVVNLDGKTLRGTIPAGESRGLHLLAAFLPAEGWVVMQVEVDQKENEVKAAPQVLKSIDLRGKIVTGDALLAQRALSVQVVEAGGDYLWTVKENQPLLCEDIAVLFETIPCVKSLQPRPIPFPSAQQVEKGHGRLERRTLQVSSALRGYLEWPYAEQVFKLERHICRLKDGKVTTETAYGITSLSARRADPQRLLELARSHWQIENGLHYRRDETLREDWCHLRLGNAARVMAIINNLVLGLLLRRGHRNVPQARRYYDAHPGQALHLIVST